MVNDGVPDPGVAVVPVPGPPDHLGQRGRGRGTDRAGGLERQRLEHPSAVVDQVSPRTDVGLVQLRPRLPRRHGVVQPGRDLVLAPHPGRRVVGPPVVVQGEAGVLSLTERQLCPTRTTGRPPAATGHDRIRTSAPPVAARPPSTASSSGNTRPYSGRGTYSTSISTSPSVQVTCRSRRCGASRPSACPRLPLPMASASTTDGGPESRAVGRLQHHGAIHVATGDRRGARRPHRPVARLLVEQPSEDRRAVETREAQPVDRPVAGSPARHCAGPTARRSRRSRSCSSAELLGDDQRSGAGSTSS